jgi:hypothetical protein
MTDLSRPEVDAKLAASEAKVDARLANFDASIKTGFAEMRADMAKQNGDVRADIAKQNADVRADMAKQNADVRADMAKQNGDFRTDMAKLQAEVHKNTADLIKWAIGLAIAIVGMTVGLLTFTNKSAEKPAPQAASQPSAPLVIAVPAGSALLTPAPQAPAATPPLTTK